ncbi:Fatty aldehyde dehydrogenase [Galdieria sulphuraria]|nr:Fatty aldehyde dehydrogenase [Galdieria sulphuraria]
MEAAARHLTPVTLELGGKSPAVIDKSCDLQKTARMIAWAKTLNCGQLCVSVDYALCPLSMLMELIEYIKSAWNEFYGEDIQYSSDYSRIVNTTHFDRLVDLLNNTRGQIVYGGKQQNRDELFIEPSIVVVSSLDDCLMKEEIFGPILPIMPYESLEQACHWIVNTPMLEQPLVLYIFSNDSLVDEQVMERVASGGVSINEVISHVMSSWLPFGGIGKSGIGVYHGKYSVQVFSHARAILKRNFRMEPLVGIRYPPTTSRKNWLLGMLTRQKI